MLSIIIPTRNEISVIEKTLKGFLAYKNLNIEIIVSDAGSTDGTIEIAKKYADKVIVHQGPSKQTIAMGRNAGAKAASGEFLAFFDADVTLVDGEKFLKRCQELFIERPELVAFTGQIRVTPENENFTDMLVFSIMSYVHYIQNNFLHMGAAAGEFQVIRKSIFEKVGGYREDFTAAEDKELFRRLAKEGPTYFDWGLLMHHSGRRAHKIGWPRLLLQWFWNDFNVKVFDRSASKSWKEIR
jgi:glycosyltransferase involved in cell wall biosynthesis